MEGGPAMEKTTKKVTLIKVALSLLSLVAVLAGQIVSQLVGSGLLAAGIPADLCNLTAAVCYALIVLTGLWLLCNKLLGLTLSDCRITAPRFHALWVVVAFALPGFVCIALINLPGYWQLFQLNDQTLGAVLSAAVFYLGLAAGFVEEAALDSRTRGLEITAEQLAPVTVSADPEQLCRVLSNILENSIKYKAKETGRLRITLEESGRLTLADDGPGVPEEALPKLFDVFYRSDPARKNPAGGSGLGLAIAAKAVQGMGGTIRARSGPHGGLAIEITLSKEEACNAENPDR